MVQGQGVGVAEGVSPGVGVGACASNHRCGVGLTIQREGDHLACLRSGGAADDRTSGDRTGSQCTTLGGVELAREVGGIDRITRDAGDGDDGRGGVDQQRLVGLGRGRACGIRHISLEGVRAVCGQVRGGNVQAVTAIGLHHGGVGAQHGGAVHELNGHDLARLSRGGACDRQSTTGLYGVDLVVASDGGDADGGRHGRQREPIGHGGADVACRVGERGAGGPVAVEVGGVGTCRLQCQERHSLRDGKRAAAAGGTAICSGHIRSQHGVCEGAGGAVGRYDQGGDHIAHARVCRQCHRELHAVGGFCGADASRRFRDGDAWRCRGSGVDDDRHRGRCAGVACRVGGSDQHIGCAVWQSL